MEATQKRGFFKGKLPKSLARVTKPRTTQHCSSPSTQNLANYSTVPRLSTYSYASFHEQSNAANLTSPSSLMQKVSYASFNFKSPSFYDQNGYANETWGHADENVDFKATTYISNVRERFKL